MDLIAMNHYFVALLALLGADGMLSLQRYGSRLQLNLHQVG